MDQTHVVGQRLADTLRRFKNSHEELVSELEDHWSAECLLLLLGSHDDAVIDAAATALGLVGTMAEVPRLASLLQHDSAAIVEIAEHALWSLFFRAGGPLAQSVLARIARSIDTGELENAVPLLTELIRSQPSFAEAYHQRAQAHYLADQYDQALRDARRACRLNPHHFAALALQGHCLAALGRSVEAHRLYHDALRLHPRMSGVRESLRQARESRPVALR